MVAVGPLCRVLFDYLLAPTIERWKAELSHVKDCVIADAKYIREHKTVLRKRPEKGVIRLALACMWVALHLYALVTFLLYGAFHVGPLHATWWFWSTAIAGVLYVLLLYSWRPFC